jgi:hypothetical protein
MGEEWAKARSIGSSEELRMTDQYKREIHAIASMLGPGAFERSDQLSACALIEVSFPGMMAE